MGWPDQHISGYIQKHYLGLKKVDGNAPAIGEFNALTPEDKAAVVADFEARAMALLTLNNIEVNRQGLGLSLGRKYSNSTCQTIGACVADMTTEKAMEIAVSVAEIDDLDVLQRMARS